MEIVQVLGGNSRPGARYLVSFGPRGGEPNLKYPHTPRMREREYFIVGYKNDDDDQRLPGAAGHRLLGFPVSAETYEEWDKEVWEYERLRALPGAGDR